MVGGQFKCVVLLAVRVVPSLVVSLFVVVFASGLVFRVSIFKRCRFSNVDGVNV